MKRLRIESETAQQLWWLGFLLVLVAAVLVRVTALQQLSATPYFSFLIYDEFILNTWAVNIATGVFSPNSEYQFAPLYPYIIAGVYKLLGIDVLYVRLLNIVLGVATCCVIYLITKELADRKTAFIAFIIGAVYEPHIFYSILPLKAALSAFLFSVGIYCYLTGKTKQSVLRIFFSGIALGLLLNVRPQVGILIPAIVIMLFVGWKEYSGKISGVIKLASAFTIGVVFAVSPFVLRNYLVASSLSITTTQAGFNLYRANKLHPVEAPVNFAETLPRVQETQFRIEASRRAGEKLTREEASTYWKKETFRIIKESPDAFFKNIFRKTLMLFKQHQLTDHYNIRFMEEFMPILGFPFLPFIFLMPLGTAGLFLMASKTAQGKDLLVLFLLYASTLVIFFMRTRYRLPLMAILVPCSAVFLVQLHAALLHRQIKTIVQYMVILYFFGFLTFFPISSDKDFTAYLNGHALVLKAAGKIDKAVYYWIQSSDSKGMYSDFANLSLTEHFLKKAQYETADEYLGRIPETSYAIAQKHLLLGEMLHTQRRFKQAAEEYRRSLFYNSGQLLPLRRLLMIYQKTRDRRKEETHRRLQYIRSFYSS